MPAALFGDDEPFESAVRSTVSAGTLSDVTGGESAAGMRGYLLSYS